MEDAPEAKRAKLDSSRNPDDIEQLVHIIWEHYRDYLDSLDPEENEDGTVLAEIDQLQELIEIAKDSIQKQSLPLDEIKDINFLEVVLPVWDSREKMLPIVLSVAYYHLADDAISQYLMMVQQQPPHQEGSLKGNESKAMILETVKNFLIQSLEWYPFNAATWSMGANFGRMSQTLSLTSARKWYEMAVQTSTILRTEALQALENESVPNDEKEWIELLVLNQIVGVQYEDEDDEKEDEDPEMETKIDDKSIGGESKEIKETEVNIEEEDKVESETGFYSSSAVESTARFMCAMLWSMEGRHDRALSHLKSFHLTHRLHPNVWEITSIEQLCSVVVPKEPPLVFQPPGGILPSHLYDAITKLFAPNAAYWKESDYSSRGYYSFFHEYDAEKKEKPKTLLEEIIINHLLPRAQQCLDTMDSNDSENICGFEWWAHTRPIQANLGHNLHFDTDESMLDKEGKVTHPILSSVLYLTGGQHETASSSPAGATIILEETPDSSTVGKKCWQGIPKDNTFLIFPGNRLHGVLPCPGSIRSTDQEGKSKTNKIGIEALIDDLRNCEAGTSSSSSREPPHRLTFMVGFWTRNVPATMTNRRLYGPCGPLPPATVENTWVNEIQEGYNNDNPVEERPVANKFMAANALSEVSPAWELIQNDDMAKDTNTNLDDEPCLTIPHGINHRFFVKGAPYCFRQSLFEDREIEDS